MGPGARASHPDPVPARGGGGGGGGGGKGEPVCSPGSGKIPGTQGSHCAARTRVGLADREREGMSLGKTRGLEKGWHLSRETHLSTSGFSARGGVGPHPRPLLLPPTWDKFQGLYRPPPQSFRSRGKSGRSRVNTAPWHRTGHLSLHLLSVRASHSISGQLPSPQAG